MVSNLKASLFSTTQENTFTLANLAFDFSLFKLEAPKEYQGTGKTLSKNHREAAETGSEHVFARKLGALFAPALPSTQHLFSAYGLRASEIAKLPSVNPKTSQNDGIF